MSAHSIDLSKQASFGLTDTLARLTQRLAWRERHNARTPTLRGFQRMAALRREIARMSEG